MSEQENYSNHMIYEYALEPNLLNNWQDFRYFIEKFGISQGRLISRYPKRWKKLVYESLTECGEVERKRIEEKLVTIDARLLLPRFYEFDRELNWETNAEIEHSKRPFHAIIAKHNPRIKDYVLEAESICASHPLWEIPRSKIIKRSAEDIASCSKTLIHISKEIKIIDPYFAPDKAIYRRPLEAILKLAINGPKGPPNKVEIHLKDHWESNHFKEECQRTLPSIIPNSILLNLIRWREKSNGEQLHNRFILTEIGGIRFGIGLCEGISGQTDEIELLHENIVSERWKNYSLESPAFDLVDVTSVKGIGSVMPH